MGVTLSRICIFCTNLLIYIVITIEDHLFDLDQQNSFLSFFDLLQFLSTLLKPCRLQVSGFVVLRFLELLKLKGQWSISLLRLHLRFCYLFYIMNLIVIQLYRDFFSQPISKYEVLIPQAVLVLRPSITDPSLNFVLHSFFKLNSVLNL